MENGMSPYLNIPKRDEETARRERGIRTVREAAQREGFDPDTAEKALKSAYGMRDVILAGVK
jgi:hypothetical protein